MIPLEITITQTSEHITARGGPLVPERVFAMPAFSEVHITTKSFAAGVMYEYEFDAIGPVTISAHPPDRALIERSCRELAAILEWEVPEP